MKERELIRLLEFDLGSDDCGAVNGQTPIPILQ